MAYVYIVTSNEDVSLKEGHADHEAVIEGDPIDAGVLIGQLTDVFSGQHYIKVLAAALVQSMYCNNYFGDVERNMYLDEIDDSNIELVFQDLMSVFGE